MCEYCNRRSWECEEGYVSYPNCESFSLDWYSLSDNQRRLIEVILKGTEENYYDF